MCAVCCYSYWSQSISICSVYIRKHHRHKQQQHRHLQQQHHSTEDVYAMMLCYWVKAFAILLYIICDTFHHSVSHIFFFSLLSLFVGPALFFFMLFRLFVCRWFNVTLTMFTRCSPLFLRSLIFVFGVYCSRHCCWFIFLLLLLLFCLLSRLLIFVRSVGRSLGRCYTYFSHIVHWIHIICFILYKFWINTKTNTKRQQ